MCALDICGKGYTCYFICKYKKEGWVDRTAGRALALHGPNLVLIHDIRYGLPKSFQAVLDTEP